jgi:hypothetical protein
MAAIPRPGLAALVLLAAALAAIPAGAAPLDDVWVGALRGRVEILVLRERADGRLVGNFPADPDTWLAGGRRDHHRVTLEIAGTDPLLSWHGTITGAWSHGALDGDVVWSDRGPEHVHLERSHRPREVVHWVLAPGESSESLLRAARVADHHGALVAGGFVDAEDCEFMGCAGEITAWTIAGAAHAITARTGGACEATTLLDGTFDPASLFLSGSWTRASACSPAGAGDFLGGREGAARIPDIEDALETLARLADRLEAESPDAIQAFAPTYLQDGTTREDWEGRLSDLFARYQAIEATVEAVRQVVTEIDALVHPLLLLPRRLEWHLAVTGIPAGGGPRQTVLELTSRFGAAEELLWIGRHDGRIVFAGNGYAEPFRIAMPIDPADTARTAFGLWPWGVHGGGHPEGHPGWDVEFQAGASVRAAADGTVERIEPNGGFAGQWRIVLRHRPGWATVYDHVGALAPGIAVGAAVTAGQPLGLAGDTGPPGTPFFITHFAVQRGTGAQCPLPYLSAAGQALFAQIFASAAYFEELAEPFPCNAGDVAFALTRAWTRTAGALAPRIDFTRSEPSGSAPYGYTLRDGTGAIIETGAVTSLAPLDAPLWGAIDLQPSGGGPPHLGLWTITGDALRIDWGAARPASLAGASVYTTPPAAP